MSKIIKKQYPNNINVTVTYNTPSPRAIQCYAHKLKEIIDIKNRIDFKKQLE